MGMKAGVALESVALTVVPGLATFTIGVVTLRGVRLAGCRCLVVTVRMFTSKFLHERRRYSYVEERFY
jgi:hypothetical protein